MNDNNNTAQLVYDSAIKKSGFAISYLENMITGVVTKSFTVERAKRAMLNTLSMPKRNLMGNCFAVDFFQPSNIHHDINTFIVPMEQLTPWQTGTGMGVATVYEPTNYDMSFDLIFIESAKDSERMIPFVYTQSYLWSDDPHLTTCSTKIVHEFVNEAIGWKFKITSSLTQRVTGMPTGPTHPITLQGVQGAIDQNEIARIIKQFTDDLDSGAYYIE